MAPVERFRGGERFVRALILGLSVVAVAVVGHGVGHAGLPGFGGLALTLPIAVVLGLCIADRRLTLRMLVAYSVGVQFVVHIVLAVAGGGGHDHASASAARDVASNAAGLDGRMLAAHAVAAVAAALVLARAESSLHCLLRYWRQLTRRHALPAVAVRRAGRLPLPSRIATRVASSIVDCDPTRGPPRGAAAASLPF